MDEESLFDMSADGLDDVESWKDVYDLSGKVAVVSGAAGLALFVANRLLECGAKVVLGDVSDTYGTMAVECLKDRGYTDVAFKHCDTSKVADDYALVDFAERTFGPVDIVVPVAATWFARAFLDVTEADYDKIVDTDMKGQYFLVQAAARSMVKAKHGGKVVTIASVAHRGDDIYEVAMMTPYNAAKAGVVGMTKGIAKELKQYGVNVNCVAPGGMLTPGAIVNNTSTGELYGAEWKQAQMASGGHTPVAGSPDDVARMVVSLCTSVSDFMYGKVVEVDGGSDLSFQKAPWSVTLPGGRPGPRA